MWLERLHSTRENRPVQLAGRAGMGHICLNGYLRMQRIIRQCPSDRRDPGKQWYRSAKFFTRFGFYFADRGYRTRDEPRSRGDNPSCSAKEEGEITAAFATTGSSIDQSMEEISRP